MENDKKHGNTGKQNAKKDNPLETGFSGRCLKSDKAKWVKKAQNEKVKLSQWMVSTLNKECEK